MTSALHKPKIYAIENLRGIAALLVCVFHLTSNQYLQGTDSLWRKIAGLGYLGVPVFFAISGFVIPWALYNSNYKINNFFSYMLKRAIRIEPPYLVSIIMLLVLNYLSSLSSLYAGLPFSFSIKQFLLHLFFLPGYFNYVWYQPVYYTLLIEFQFYILCGLLFVVFASSKRWATYALLIAALLACRFFPVHF
ncbi:MAG: acyltransferase, partial [Mucilaginibacter sp.]